MDTRAGSSNWFTVIWRFCFRCQIRLGERAKKIVSFLSCLILMTRFFELQRDFDQRIEKVYLRHFRLRSKNSDFETHSRCYVRNLSHLQTPQNPLKRATFSIVKCFVSVRVYKNHIFVRQTQDVWKCRTFRFIKSDGVSWHATRWYLTVRAS